MISAPALLKTKAIAFSLKKRREARIPNLPFPVKRKGASTRRRPVLAFKIRLAIPSHNVPKFR